MLLLATGVVGVGIDLPELEDAPEILDPFVDLEWQLASPVEWTGYRTRLKVRRNLVAWRAEATQATQMWSGRRPRPPGLLA